MLASIINLARQRLLGLTVIVLLVAPATFALARTSSSSVRICVKPGTRELRSVASPGHCRSGETSFTVNHAGRRGPRGVPGKNGAQGRAGPAGAAGVVGNPGPIGATGPQGIAGRAGTDGTPGTNGATGADGAPGATGADGAAGPPGATGARGTDGAAGPPGPPGATGATGPAGPQGNPGVDGVQGPTGPGGPTQYAQFYALIPTDNPKPVAPGSDVEFPQDGPRQGKIARLTDGTFLLPEVATYRVAFSVPITETAQLQLTLNGKGLPYAVYGRDTGMSPVAGDALITTDANDSVLSVMNVGAGDITLTPFAGGPLPVTASLLIEQFN